MDLSSLRPAPNSKKKKKRVGRGEGSGHGKTSCRGHKGLGARSGGNVRPGFEGGQMPLMRRVPKRGFHSPFKKGYALVNLGQLEVFESGAVVGPEQLHTQGLIRNKIATVKILGDGKLTKALVVKAHKFSAKAAETITALGGKTETIADA